MAFRVECDRNAKEVRIAAAELDYARELYLSIDALTWKTTCSINDLDVNLFNREINAGLHLWKPDTVGCPSGNLYEISVMGEVYHLRVNNKWSQKADRVNNILTDGCIVVNAELVLLFSTISPYRGQEFLASLDLQRRLEQEKSIFCAITLDNIHFSSPMFSSKFYSHGKASDPALRSARNHVLSLNTGLNGRPGVFPNCGHVFKLLDSEEIKNQLTRYPKYRIDEEISPLII